MGLGSLPYCSSSSSYRHAESKASELFFYGKWTPNDCNCSPQCKKILFTSSLESNTDRYKIHSKRMMARVRIYYQVGQNFLFSQPLPVQNWLRYTLAFLYD